MEVSRLPGSLGNTESAGLTLPTVSHWGTCLTCSCLPGLSCPIVNPEIDFLLGSLVRFIYKIVPQAWSSSELFSWQNCCLAPSSPLADPCAQERPRGVKRLIRFNVSPTPWGFSSLIILFLVPPNSISNM